jgi:alkyl sulfatase BDS1-like metallo-beta-lactamase superfamily hydrolase
MPAGIFPVDPDEPEVDIARRQIKLLRAGVLGEPNGRTPDASPEVQRIYFDLVARSVNQEAVNGRSLTIQWRFADAGNWHLVVDNGLTRVEPGDAPSPDIALETTWKDWLDVSTRGAPAWRAVVGRRLRPRGSISALRRLPKLFPTRVSVT